MHTHTHSHSEGPAVCQTAADWDFTQKLTAATKLVKGGWFSGSRVLAAPYLLSFYFSLCLPLCVSFTQQVVKYGATTPYTNPGGATLKPLC